MHSPPQLDHQGHRNYEGFSCADSPRNIHVDSGKSTDGSGPGVKKPGVGFAAAGVAASKYGRGALPPPRPGKGYRDRQGPAHFNRHREIL